jgi:hypothetical protein
MSVFFKARWTKNRVRSVGEDHLAPLDIKWHRMGPLVFVSLRDCSLLEVRIGVIFIGYCIGDSIATL